MRIFPKRTSLFLLLILLLVVAYLLWSPKREQNPFARIDLIKHSIPCSLVITAGTSDVATLTFDGERWLVGDTSEVNVVRVENLLYALPRITFLNPIPQAMQETMREKLHSKGYCIRLFDIERRQRVSIYVMYEEGVGIVSEQGNTVFLLDMTGVNFDPSEDLSASPAFWCTTQIFDFPASSIKTICIQHLLDAPQSFCIYRKPDQELRLTGLASADDSYTYDEDVMRRYLTYFSRVNADKVIIAGDREQQALKNDLQHIIGVEGEDNDICTIACVGLKLPDGSYDTDKFLLYHYEKNRWSVASWVNFDLLLKNLEDLLVKNS